jgi:hypothetical protein
MMPDKYGKMGVRPACKGEFADVSEFGCREETFVLPRWRAASHSRDLAKSFFRHGFPHWHGEVRVSGGFLDFLRDRDRNQKLPKNLA